MLCRECCSVWFSESSNKWVFLSTSLFHVAYRGVKYQLEWWKIEYYSLGLDANG